MIDGSVVKNTVSMKKKKKKDGFGENGVLKTLLL